MDSETSGATAGPAKRRRSRKKRESGGLDMPTLGYIPATPGTPAPVLADPVGDAAGAYEQALDRVQAATKGRVLLVTGTDPGPGASLTALNLGMAATRVGQRAVVVDGDGRGGGPSRFLRTGPVPGLNDVAAGTADLREASRLLELDADHLLPMVPSGSNQEEIDFTAADIAESVDLMSEHADLVLVYLPFDASEERTSALGTHADGSVLVVEEGTDTEAIAATSDRLSDVGAPVAGVVERALPRARGNRRKRRKA